MNQLTEYMKTEKEISDLVMEIDTTSTMTYYNEFSTESERQKDLAGARYRLRQAHEKQNEAARQLIAALQEKITENEKSNEFMLVKFKEAS